MSDETIHQDVTRDIYKTVIDLKEQGIKDALISLGWKPPSKEPLIPLREVLELLQSHRLKYAAGSQINVATNIIDIFKEKLIQKYEVRK